MKEKVIYGFITDTFLVPNIKLDLGLNIEPKVGFISKLMKSYFGVFSKLEDDRITRLNVLGQQIDGTIAVHFDGSIELQKTTISTLTEQERTSLFNIIERVYLTQSVDHVALDTDLTSSSDFNGYIPGSLFLSSTYITHATKILSTDPDPTDLNIPTYIMFDALFGGEEYTFKFWLSNKDFVDDYPLSIITNIIFPCDAKYFLDFTKYKNILQAVTDSSKFSFEKTHLAVSVDDHTGLFPFETRYNVSENSNTFMPFGVMYKGKRPSTLAMREEIRKELEALGIADSATWESLFPDLYVKAQFYLIPMWNNTTIRPERTIIPSINNLNDMTKVLKIVFSSVRPEFINEHAEIIANGFNEVFCAVMPDPLNMSMLSLREIHPTYTYHPAQHPGHIYMDKKTQEFNIRFNRCISVIYGASTSNEFVPVDLDDRTFMTFVVGGVEYYVLTESGFPFEDMKP